MYVDYIGPTNETKRELEKVDEASYNGNLSEFKSTYIEEFIIRLQKI